jgi:hypothetical protein
MTPLIVQQCVLKLALFFRHIRSIDDIGRQLQITMGLTQLELGVGVQFFKLKHKQHYHLLTDTWITHLWEFLSLSDIQLWHANSEAIWLPTPQREQDALIMDIVLSSCFSLPDQKIINEWRVYLRALSIADLANLAGTRITSDIHFGWRTSERHSKYKWPVASRPHQDLLHVWQTFLDSLLNERHLLKCPLGDWYTDAECHKTWSYKQDPMGGVWRYDHIIGSFTELRPYARVTTNRKRFHRLQFAEPLQLATAAEIAHWPTIEILERGPQMKLTLFVTALAHAHLRPFTQPPPIPPPSLTIPPSDECYNNFVFLLDEMDAARRRIVGLPNNSLPSPPEYNFVSNLYANGELYCVSDGSFDPKIGIGSNAWIMTNEAQQFSMLGAGPVDGDPSKMSAYRPELHGILANLIILNTIASTYVIPVGSPVTLVCDNEAAIIELDKILTAADHVIDPLQTDYDLLLEIQGEVTLSTAKFTAKWVRGHQEGKVNLCDLDFLAILNINCDKRAKAYLRLHAGTPISTAVIYKHERWGAVWGGQKITSDLKEAVYEHYTYPATVAYLCKKFNWTLNDIGLVAWQGVHHAKQKVTLARNTFSSKIMFDKLPVAERLNYFDSIESPRCQTCQNAIETQQHMFQCKNKDCKKHRLRCWVKHCKQILGGHTSRIIMDAIDENVRAYLNLRPRPMKWQRHQGNRSVFAAVQRAIVAQNKIGWDKFLSGIISKQWGFAQQLYWDVTGDYPKRIPRTWSEGVITILWDFSHDIWLYRNTIRHGVTQADQQLKRRARVVALVTDRYTHRPHLDAKYNFLFRKPLLSRLEEGNRTLYAWLGSVANLSSLSTKPLTRQQSIRAHATFQRLSDFQADSLSRPKRRLRRLFGCPASNTKKSCSKFALGARQYKADQRLTKMWNFSPNRLPAPSAPIKRKRFKTSIVSDGAKQVWDRGKFNRIIT